jgi:hypothetical protein
LNRNVGERSSFAGSVHGVGGTPAPVSRNRERERRISNRHTPSTNPVRVVFRRRSLGRFAVHHRPHIPTDKPPRSILSTRFTKHLDIVATVSDRSSGSPLCGIQTC